MLVDRRLRQMIITANVWRPDLFDEQLKYSESTCTPATCAIYFGQLEPLQWDASGQAYTLLTRFMAYAAPLNIPVYIILNNNNLTTYEKNLINDLSMGVNLKIIFWDTYWFTDLWNTILAGTITNTNLDESTKQDEFRKYLTNYNFLVGQHHNRNYHYICLNNHPHLHKVKMIDTLAKHNLIGYGAVSWLQNGTHMKTSEELQIETFSSFGYQYKYWVPKIIRLDVDAVDGETFYYRGKVPVEYEYTFMHLITETYCDPVFISEKTPTALLLMKPFLAIAAAGYHKNLEKLGFKLYDEIFDYSFDDADVVEDRCEGIAENIKKISKLSVDELRISYNLLVNKLQYNKQLALTFSTSIPSEIRELFNLNSDAPHADLFLKSIVQRIDSYTNRTA